MHARDDPSPRPGKRNTTLGARCTLGMIQVRAQGNGILRLAHEAFDGGGDYGQWLPVEHRESTKDQAEHRSS
jgi:hypothetical protein